MNITCHDPGYSACWRLVHAREIFERSDRSWEEYDEASTTLVMERTLAFLDRVG